MFAHDVDLTCILLGLLHPSPLQLPLHPPFGRIILISPIVASFIEIITICQTSFFTRVSAAEEGTSSSSHFSWFIENFYASIFSLLIRAAFTAFRLSSNCQSSFALGSRLSAPSTTTIIQQPRLFSSLETVHIQTPSWFPSLLICLQVPTLLFFNVFTLTFSGLISLVSFAVSPSVEKNGLN